jgi:hypothetical protein
MPHWRSYVLASAFSALGLLGGHWLSQHWPTASITEAQSASGALSATSFELVDAQGSRRILMGTSSEGSPAIWFFDRKGKARLNLGLYGDDNAFIVLNDDQERAVQIFRTVGSESAPYLVMKAEGRDRIVMGLSGSAQDPFLVHYDTDGRVETVFGSYRR